MTVKVRKIKAKIVELNTTTEAVARDVGIDRATFYRKLQREGKSFTIGEIHRLVKALRLTQQEAVDIFLT